MRTRSFSISFFIFLLPFFCLLFTQCIASGQIFFPEEYFENLDEPTETVSSSEPEESKPLCQSDHECGELEICQNEVCQPRMPACQSDADCPLSTKCSGNLCLEAGVCYFHYQCPAEQQCESFRCVPERCEQDGDCAAGESCDISFGGCRETRCDAESVDSCDTEQCCNTLTGYCVPAVVCERFENGIPHNCEAIPEKCDHEDNDCDGAIDEDFSELGTSCSVGTGVCLRIGHFICSANQTGVVCNVQPGPSDPEVCDGVDNDCDGQVDEGC